MMIDIIDSHTVYIKKNMTYHILFAFYGTMETRYLGNDKQFLSLDFAAL